MSKSWFGRANGTSRGWFGYVRAFASRDCAGRAGKRVPTEPNRPGDRGYNLAMWLWPRRDSEFASTATQIHRKPKLDVSLTGVVYGAMMLFMGMAAINSQANLLFGV